jgi:hypothetical protein
VTTERSAVDELSGQWQDDPDELGALFEQLCDACEPEHEIELGLLQMAFSDLTEARRQRHIIEMIEEALIVDAKNVWWDWHENRVKLLTPRLTTEPQVAVAELKRTWLGCLWLTECWVQLQSLLKRESASQDVARLDPSPPKQDDLVRRHLSQVETDRLTRVYGMLAQGEPRESEILAFYADTSRLPEGVTYPSSIPLPPRSECRKRVQAVIERELPPLKAYGRKLLIEYEDPALETYVNGFFSRDRMRSYLLDSRSRNERSFRETYNGFKKPKTRRKGFASEYPLLAAEVEATRLKRAKKNPG